MVVISENSSQYVVYTRQCCQTGTIRDLLVGYANGSEYTHATANGEGVRESKKKVAA